MDVVITCEGQDLDSELCARFGRAPVFLVVDVDTAETEAVRNPAVEAESGAGIQSAQLVADRGVRHVITGRVGPKAMAVLAEAGVSVYGCEGGTARDALEQFRRGNLARVVGAGGGGGRRMGGGGRGGGRGSRGGRGGAGGR